MLVPAPDPLPQAQHAPGRSDRKARAERLAAQLESQIAINADQRAVFSKAFEHPVVVEPHRDHHAYHLGADLFYCGLATGDALALMGLMSMGPAYVGQLLAKAAQERPNIYVTRLWPCLIDANRDEYEARGQYVSWQRRWARYTIDADGWAQSALNGPDGVWRDRHMTSGQRQLVHDCAIISRIHIPEGMNRGQAHDWLMENGANAVYRKGA